MAGEVIRAKVREFTQSKRCEFCHTTFGEHSEEQFDACWKRLREERKQLQREGKIPTPKINVTITDERDPAESYRKIRQKYGQHTCPLCKRIFDEHSDDELQTHSTN